MNFMCEKLHKYVHTYTIYTSVLINVSLSLKVKYSEAIKFPRPSSGKFMLDYVYKYRGVQTCIPLCIALTDAVAE